MDSIISWFIRNHVAANFLMAAILVMGVASWFKLSKEIFPDTSIDTVMVRIPFPAATPEEVEKGVVVPIEEAIQDLDGIDRIRSTAAQGAGTVLAQVRDGYRLRDVMDDIKTRVDGIDSFPEEAEQPRYEEIFITAQVLSIAVSADTDERTLRELAEQVRDGLLVYEPPPGRGVAAAFRNLFGGPSARTAISRAQLAGTRPYELSIEVSEQTLRQYGLTFTEVTEAVRASSLDLPGGSVRTDAGEILLRTEARRYEPEEFADITVVTRPDGSVVRLGDIARIVDGFEEGTMEVGFNGRPTILINVYRTGNEDTIVVADAARRFIEEEAPRLVPPGVEFDIWKDDSQFLRDRLSLLMRNGLLGLLLVFLVLAMFLRPSLAALVALGIPVSFAGAIWLMPVTGISLNMISLFAFILVLGIVVDDAIIVGENVFRRMREGEEPRLAAERGTHEVGVVVIFGVVTTMVAFTPMLGVSGVSGKIWPNIPLVVIPVLLFSIIQSKLVLPAHLALLPKQDPDRRRGPVLRFQRSVSHGLERFVESVFRPLLARALRVRYLVVAGFVSVLLLSLSLLTLGFIKFEFFPNVEADVISAKVTLPQGVPVEATRQAVAQIEAAAAQLGRDFTDDRGQPIIVHTLATVGGQPFQTGFVLDGFPRGDHLGEVTLELVPAHRRSARSEELAAAWRRLTGEIAGAEELTFQTEAAGGGSAIELQIAGDDMEMIEAATARVKDALASYRGVIDISDSNRAGKQEIRLFIRPDAEALGLRLADVASQVRQGFYGDEVQRLQRDRDEVKVFVRYPEERRTSIADLENMRIRLRDGTEVPFSAVARAEYGRSYSTIERSDRRRMIQVNADIDRTENVNATEVTEDLEETVLQHLARDFPGTSYRFEGEQSDQRQSVEEIMAGFILAMIGMYMLLAVPLRSYLQPLIVMSVIPFGLIGAIAGHVLLGLDFSIMSLCGVVALAGVVVNDSLVLVDYVNRHQRDGHTVVSAATEAGAIRFRAILLTSLTTFAGLTPMLLETDIQARFLIPMAVSLAFGVLFATVITLILVPSLYLILEDFKRLVTRRRGVEQQHEPLAAAGSAGTAGD